MQKNFKFKNYIKLKKDLLIVQKKALNFKRSKWIEFKSNFISNKVFSRKLLLNFERIFIRGDSLSVLKNRYRNFVFTKILLKEFYKNSFNNKLLRKLLFKNRSFLKKDLFNLLFIKIEYKLDLLLWKLKFTESIEDAKKLILNKKILVNNNSSHPNYFLKKGDIISFNSNIHFEKIHSKFLEYNKIYFSFLEFDYYTTSLCVIKDYSDFNYLEASLFFSKRLKLFDLFRLIFFKY
jgi:ribosomal protein S4